MSTTIPAIPELIELGDGMTVSRADAIAAAGHLVASYRLLYGDSHTTMDLALLRLHDMLFGGEADSIFPALAMDLIGAALEEA